MNGNTDIENLYAISELVAPVCMALIDWPRRLLEGLVWEIAQRQISKVLSSSARQRPAFEDMPRWDESGLVPSISIDSGRQQIKHHVALRGLVRSS
jgi:hypothetical protein